MKHTQNILWKETHKILLLIALYALQGLSLGFFLMSVPIIFKKYLTYSELSVIMMSTAPFSFKVLWSPVIEFYHFKRFGKRKSWIVPTQLLMAAMVLYFKENLEQLLIEKQVYLVATILTSIVFVITCQDIAVDAWAVEMLHPENSEYGGTSQSIGHRIGFFVSGTIFIAMSDADFCQKWFGSSEPVWDLSSFLGFFAMLTLFLTFYVAFFVPEIDPEIEAYQKTLKKDEKEEPEATVGMTINIAKDVLKNKNI
jgi:MFS transporter, PAT family, solute carrier family 33 (acetyl-CoA transportor), member 1